MPGAGGRHDVRASPPPPCIDDFDVGQELGKGGFAVVYRARVRASGLEVALKVVDKHRACEHLSNNNGTAGGEGGGTDGVELACARVANEVRLHWGLKHPTVVELLDFFEDERFVYMVLELCGGGDLYRRLRERGPLAEEEAGGYMGQLLAGLAYLHERGVMHRDLKLSNLLLSEDGKRLRIGDFGLAVKLDDEDHERYTICGTPNYMAPEVQGPGYGLSADLWSAGCLFYTMVTGGAPFQGRRVGDTLANARTGRYVEPEGLTAAAKDFLACMLSLDPTRRMRVEQAAAHPFLRLDKRHPGGDTPVKPPVGVSPREKVLTAAAFDAPGVKQKASRAGRKSPSIGPKRRDGHGSSAAPSGGKAVDVSRSSLLSSPGSGSSKADGSGTGGAAGHSTLTASTTVLGSDRFSIDSSLLEREDAASFSTLRAEAVPTPATIGQGAVAAAARARLAAARAPFGSSTEGAAVGIGEAIGRSGGGGEGAGRRAGGRASRPSVVKESYLEAGQVQDGAGGPDKSRERLGLRRSSTDPALFAGEHRRHGGAIKARDASRGGERDSGRDVKVGSERGKERSTSRGWRSHDGSNGSGGLGVNPVETRTHRNNEEPETSCYRLEPPDNHQKQKQQRRRQPPRRRRRTLPAPLSPHKQRQQTEVDERANFIGSTQRRYHPGGYGGHARSSDDSPPRMPATCPPASRRRQRESGRAASRPPPPRPPRPPPLPGEERTLQPRELHLLREARALAAAQRHLYETGCTGGSTSTGVGVAAALSGSPAGKEKTVRGLVPLSTARVKPVSHHSGGRAAIEVLPDGRASITVGKRWLMASGDGERVWARGMETGGFSKSDEGNASNAGRGRASRAGARSEASMMDSATRSGSAEAGHSLQSLPEAFHPLYRSLAGIVNALRSKTPKVVLRRELRGYVDLVDKSAACAAGGGSSAGDRRPARTQKRDPTQKTAELVLCTLMENLPDPDFAAAFDDGASMSLWTRKGELRVELPCGRSRSWPVAPGLEWPAIDERRHNGDGGNGWGTAAGMGAGRTEEPESDKEKVYLRAGFDGYCRCLREEAAAYRRGATFPVEISAVIEQPAMFRPSNPPRDHWKEGYRRGGKPANATNAPVFAEAGGRRPNDETRSSRSHHGGAPLKAGTSEIGSWWRGQDSNTSSDSSLAEQQGGFDNRSHRGGGGGGGSKGSGGRSANAEQQPFERRERSDGTTREGVDYPGLEPDQASTKRHDSQNQRQQRWRQACPTEPRDTPPRDLSGIGFRPSPPLSGRMTSPLPAAAEDAPRPLPRRDREAALLRQADPVLCVDDKMLHRGDSPSADTRSLTCSSASEDWKARTEGRRTTGGSGGGGDGGARDTVYQGKSSGLVRGQQAGAVAAVIPGLGEAFRDGRGDLEVRFSDGVVVVVDAGAKWMRVERPLPPEQEQAPKFSTPSASGACLAQRAVTYDLGGRGSDRDKGAATATAGEGAKPVERMPRDVKSRMKALPRFIAILKGVPSAGKGKAAAAAARGAAAGGAGVMEDVRRRARSGKGVAR